MLVKQVAELVNASAKEFLGETAVLNEDLSNVVDYGTELFNNTDVDNYVKSLVDQIGKIIFVNRPYTGNTPSVLMDSWEFGSVLEKISGDLYDADENETWELEDGKVYEQQTFSSEGRLGGDRENIIIIRREHHHYAYRQRQGSTTW